MLCKIDTSITSISYAFFKDLQLVLMSCPLSVHVTQFYGWIYYLHDYGRLCLVKGQFFGFKKIIKRCENQNLITIWICLPRARRYPFNSLMALSFSFQFSNCMYMDIELSVTDQEVKKKIMDNGSGGIQLKQYSKLILIIVTAYKKYQSYNFADDPTSNYLSKQTYKPGMGNIATLDILGLIMPTLVRPCGVDGNKMVGNCAPIYTCTCYDRFPYLFYVIRDETNMTRLLHKVKERHKCQNFLSNSIHVKRNI